MWITLTGFTGFPIEIGLFGKYTLDGKTNYPGTVPYDSDDSMFGRWVKRFAFSWNFGAEATWKEYSVGFEYNRHITNDSDAGGSIHNQTISLNLGYNFHL